VTPALPAIPKLNNGFVHDVLFGGYADGGPKDWWVNRFVEDPVVMLFDG